MKIPADAATSLLLEKHAEYIAAYGNKKDDYVRFRYIFNIINVLSWDHTLPLKLFYQFEYCINHES